MAFVYPAGDEQVTLHLGLATWGMDEVLAENMILIDAFAAGPFGATVKVNGTAFAALNFNNTTPAAPGGDTNVTFQVDASGNVTAYAPTPVAAGVTSFNTRTGAVIPLVGDYAAFYAPISGGSSAWAALTGDLTETQVIPWDGGTVGTPDTGISRTAPGRLALGNGTAGNASGELSLLAVVGENSASTLYFSNDPAFASGFSVSLGPITAFIGANFGSFIPGTTWDSTDGSIRNNLGALAVGFQIVASNNDTIFIYPDLSGGELLFEQAGVGTGQLIFNAASTTGLISLACGNNGTSFTGTILFSLGTSSGTPTIVNPASGSPVLTWPSTTGTLALLTDNNPSGTVIGWNSDSGISRLGVASLAIGNGAAGDFSGSLKLTGISIQGTLTDGSASVGTSGQILESTATGVKWVTVSTGETWAGLTGDLTETQVIPWDGGTVGTPDTGISRLGPAFLAIGNGLAGDFTGTLRLKVLSIETAGVGVETLSLDAVTGLMQTSGGLEVGGALSSSGAFQSVGLASVGTTAIAAGATGGQLILQPSSGNASSVGWEENGVALRGALGFAAASSTLIYQSGVKTLTGTTVFGIGSTGNLLIGGTDTGVSRLAAASLAIGNGTAGNISGNLSASSVTLTGAATGVAMYMAPGVAAFRDSSGSPSSSDTFYFDMPIMVVRDPSNGYSVSATITKSSIQCPSVAINGTVASPTAGTYYSGGAAGITQTAIAVGTLATTGGLVTTFTGVSDERLKNFTLYKGGLAEILAITPIRFTYNELGQKFGGWDKEHIYVGFSAQNVQKSIPEAIQGTEGVEKYLSFDDRPVIAAAVCAIKELHAIIQAQSERIKLLEGR